jgi:hypothetical protein
MGERKKGWGEVNKVIGYDTITYDNNSRSPKNDD